MVPSLDAGDQYQQRVWELAVVDQDAPALCNQDLLRIHLYAVDEKGNAFAERYPSSMGGLGGAVVAAAQVQLALDGLSGRGFELE